MCLATWYYIGGSMMWRQAVMFVACKPIFSPRKLDKLFQVQPSHNQNLDLRSIIFALKLHKPNKVTAKVTVVL